MKPAPYKIELRTRQGFTLGIRYTDSNRETVPIPDGAVGKLVARAYRSHDAPLVLSKIAEVVDDEIYLIDISAEETATLRTQEAWYEFQVMPADGEPYLLLEGVFDVIESVS